MQNIKLIIEYDGSGFSGWGKQPGRRTVQGCIENAIEKVSGNHIAVISASRTDSGVHAKGQTVNFLADFKIPLKRIPRVLMAALPHDIVVRKAEFVVSGFNSRKLAKGKLYSYLIVDGDMPCALARRYVWHIPRKLDLVAMKKASKFLVGKHDFTSFALTDKRRKLLDPYRNIFSIKFKIGKLKDFLGDLGEPCKGRAIKIEFRGSGFLYKMIRGIVGTLADVGHGKIKASHMKMILSKAKRSAAGKTAPAKGLTLLRVEY